MGRDILDLEAYAIKFWPVELAEKERELSVVPILIETQESFISFLDVAVKDPFAWKSTLEASGIMHANLFLKHLMVLSDIGGEYLKNFKKETAKVFPNGVMEFHWNGADYSYKFKSLDRGAWDNLTLKVDGKGLFAANGISDSIEDVTNLLLYAGSAIAEKVPQNLIEKCVIGSLIGRKAELEAFVRQRYIWVSRIIGGASANNLGYLVQNYAIEHLKEKLPDWDFSRKTIPDVTQNDRTNISFDIVAQSSHGIYCAIEVSFQVTTNSTIERKAGQAKDRQAIVHEAGHHIAYIIDGAGNFMRSSALKTILQFSDCTVTFSDEELNKLVSFLKGIDV
jgi:hypothetical protein